jgi:hypothetical protein
VKYWRQGDVCIVPLDELGRMVDFAALTPVERDNGRVVLAYGEVTGHAHAIADNDVELFAPGEATVLAERYLRVGSAGAVLVHEEHAPIELPAGDYEVRHQREYSPESLQRVLD